MTDHESLAIKICRVLCIFFVSYVHVSPTMGNWGSEAPNYLIYIGNVLSGVFGRASVPALSVLSGFLAYSAYQRRSQWLKYIIERFKVLVIPLITWNLVIIGLSLAIYFIMKVETSFIRNFIPFSSLNAITILDSITGYNYGSVAITLNFLRDIFICSISIPFFIYFFKYLGAIGLFIVWSMGLKYGFWPLILDPFILMFFAIGFYFGSQSTQLIPKSSTLMKATFSITGVLVLVYLFPELQGNDRATFNQSIFRLIVTSSFLLISYQLSKTALGKAIAKLEPYAYLMFLSQITIIMLLWGVWTQIYGKSILWPYAAFFVLTPFLTYAITVLLYKLLRFMPTTIQKILNGRKVISF